MTNDEIIRLALSRFNGQEVSDSSLVGNLVDLMHGEALPVGTANADRLREIAREICAPITEPQGYFWMSLTERAASGG